MLRDGTGLGLYYVKGRGLFLLIATRDSGDYIQLNPDQDPLVYIKQLETLRYEDDDNVYFVGCKNNLTFNANDYIEEHKDYEDVNELMKYDLKGEIND